MNPITLEGCETRGGISAWATFSACGKYRYLLGRCWDLSLPVLSVDMLNPSTATEEVNDPTVSKCVTIAVAEKFGALVVRNLAGYRATDPKELLVCNDPVGPLNRDVLSLGLTDTRVGAWGRIGKRTASRLQTTLWRAERRCTHVFQWTDKAPFVPRHPLFLKNATRLIPIASKPEAA
jgi:hypothetical protein